MARIFRMALYMAKSMFRNKSLMFWSIAWPVMWVLLFAYVFMPPASGVMSIHIALLDNDAGPPTSIHTYPNTPKFTPANFTKALMNSLAAANESGKAKYYVKVFKNACVGNLSSCLVKARKLLIYRKFDVAVVIPRNASKLYTFWIPVKILVIIKGGMPSEEYMRYGSIMNALNKVMINSTIDRVDKAVKFVEGYISRYASTNYKANVSKYVKYFFYGIAFPVYPKLHIVKPKSIADRAGMLGWMALGAVGMSLMTTLLTSGAGFLIHRKSEGVLRRLLASPASIYEFLGEDLIESLIITAVVSAVTIIVGLGVGARVLFNASNPADYLAFAMAFIAGLFAYGLGFLLTPINRSTRSSGAATALGLILTFTTGIWWPPRELLPPALRAFSSVFPPACAFQAMRDILVWGKPIQYTMNNILIAVIGTAALYALIGLVFRGRLRGIAERFV